MILLEANGQGALLYDSPGELRRKVRVTIETLES